VTRWTPGSKAEAIGLALTLGSVEAAKRTGIPRRTISSWLGPDADMALVTPAILASEEAIAARLWETLALGLEEVRRGLLDPKARLGDKARAVEVIATQWQLLSGRATARSENVTLNLSPVDALTLQEQAELRDYIDASYATAVAQLEEETDALDR
jgi:hypothetical protein